MSASQRQPLLPEEDRDHERDLKDGVLDKPVFKIAFLVLLVVLVIVFTTAGLVTRFDIYNKDTSVTLGAGDVWSVSVQKSGSFSGLFCAEYGVKSSSPEQTSPGVQENQTGGLFNVYALSEKASLANGTVKRRIHDEGTLGRYAFHRYFVYHIPSWGNITVKACSEETGITVVRCKDEKSARSLIDKGAGYQEGDCSYKQCGFPKCGLRQYNCSYPGVPEGIGAPIVLVVYRGGSGSGGQHFKIDFDITGSTYALDKKVASCVNSTSCVLPVPTDAVDIVLEMPVDTKVNPSHFMGSCLPRIPVYISLFVGLPLAIVVLVGACGYFLRKGQANVNRLASQADRVREYRSLGRNQESLLQSNFLSPKQEAPPAYQQREGEGNIQTPTTEQEEVLTSQPVPTPRPASSRPMDESTEVQTELEPFGFP